MQLGLHESAKAAALERGTRCPDCGDAAACTWDNGVSAVVCQTCGQIISRRWVPRAAVCGEKAIDRTRGVTLRVVGRRKDGTKRASFAGIYYCNKPWQCPRCAQRQSFLDARTLHACNMGWRGYWWDERAARWRHTLGAPRRFAYLLSMTLPHHRRQALEPMRRAVTTSFRKCHAGAPWRRVKTHYGIRAMVRALEVNVGAAGWHPHVHAVLLVDHKLTDAEISELRNWYWARWSKAVVAAGYRCPSRTHGVDLIEADKAGKYLAKMGLAELAGGREKVGRCPKCSAYKSTEWKALRRRCVDCGREVNRTHWQVLEDLAEHGAEHDRRLWRRWCAEIRGARRLTWSRDKIADEKTTRELYADYIRIPEQAACECSGLDPECKRQCVHGRYTRHRLRRAPPKPELELEAIEALRVPPEVWEYARRSADLRVQLLEAYESGDPYAIEAALGPWMPPARPVPDHDAEVSVVPTDDTEPAKVPHVGLVLSLEELAELREARRGSN